MISMAPTLRSRATVGGRSCESLQSVNCRARDLNILVAIPAAHADRVYELAIDHERERRRARRRPWEMSERTDASLKVTAGS
jgi:hypothetical protein